jgi:PAS domain-containing protein
MRSTPPTKVSLAEDPEFFALLTRSYARLVGSPLVAEECGPTWLYHEAPFAVVAHNTEADPCFIYANEAAQACFEYPWHEFIQLRSRFSAEPPNRFERQRLLTTVAEKGFVTGYSGLRISRSGRRFWIQDGVIWQLMNEIGISFGQAAVFRSWRDA